jgi:hypothetical protein
MATASFTLPPGASLDAFRAVAKAGATLLGFVYGALDEVFVSAGVSDLAQAGRIEAALKQSYPDLEVIVA